MSQEIEILIVEESLSQAEQLKHILDQHGHKVLVEHNAELALAAIRHRKPQIVISAVELPEMDGYALCREIKADENLQDIPVILLTSLSEATDIIHGMECGADNFVTKPYDEKLLLSRIEYIVLNRELRVGSGTQTGLDIIFNGEKYSITPERQQIVDLLISTYETAVQKNLELLRIEEELNALNELLEEKVKTRTAELMREIAERKQADEALQENEDRYRDLVENSHDLICTHDLEGKILSVNQTAAKALSYERDAILGRDIRDGLLPEFRDEFTDYIAEIQKDGHARGLMTVQLRTGERRIWEYNNTLRTEGVDVPIVRGMAIDVTERKRAEAALRESEERNHRFFDEVLAGAYISTPDGKLLTCNPAFARIFGFASVEEAMKSSLDIIYIDSQAREAFLDMLREMGKLENNEFELRRRDGSPIHVLENVVGVFDEQGTLVEIRGHLLDITERKLAEQALIESEGRLQQSQKMEAIGTLAGGVAHDFNNLLTAILGNTQLALRHLAPDDPLQLRLIEVEKAGSRAAVLTRQLLAFSRRQHLERRTINLNETIGEILKLLQRIIGEDVDVQVKYAPDLCAVFADPVQIEQVIMNLGVNARDAMPHGGQLTIETSNVELDEDHRRKHPYVECGQYIEIRVSDTGSGMDEETQAHIFEPFFTTKEVGRGTGLGLSMVYGIVRQHGGYIDVLSEVGQGTTFKIFLPVDRKPVEKESPTVQTPLIGGTETILVAEDEEALRNLARAVLEELGYTVLLAKDGEDAVELYDQNRERIDMLLMDVVMPRVGGWEAYERIRQLGGDVPLIFMTGYSSETVQSRSVKQNKSMEELGAVVLQKPYNIEGLGRKIREVLDTARRK